jgi:two-component system, response regulator
MTFRTDSMDRHILLVEDNPDDVDLTLMALEKSNIMNEVKVARDGEEALQMLLGRDGEPPPRLPAVVLLDLNMPRVNGLEVLREIRGNERIRRLPVVILTSSGEEQDIVRGYDLGANSYIRKPVDFENFVNAVRQLGLYWLVLNEPGV